MKTILSIIPFEMTLHDFYEVLTPIKNLPLYHFYNKLPEWCIRDDNGHIDYTQNYHQFTGLIDDDNPKKYFLLDINPVDIILKEEISNSGVEVFFRGFDWRPLFNKIQVNHSFNEKLSIPFSSHIVVDIDYINMGDNDYNLIVEVLGYLDQKMEFCRI